MEWRGCQKRKNQLPLSQDFGYPSFLWAGCIAFTDETHAIAEKDLPLDQRTTICMDHPLFGYFAITAHF